MNFLLASFLAPIFYGAGMIIESQLSVYGKSFSVILIVLVVNN